MSAGDKLFNADDGTIKKKIVIDSIIRSEGIIRIRESYNDEINIYVLFYVKRLVGSRKASTVVVVVVIPRCVV